MMTSRSFVALLALTLSVVAQDLEALKAPKEALLFKSGQAYLYRELSVPLDASSARFRLPTGIHGTLWLGSDDIKLARATADFATTSVRKPVESLLDVLRMAGDQEIRLTIQQGRDTVIQPLGHIVKFLGALNETPAGADPEPSKPNAVVFASGQDGKVAVYPISSILSVLGVTASETWSYDAPVKTAVLDVDYAPNENSGEGTGIIGLSSMANGMAWAPSYVLELGKDDKARLVGKAVVMNDLEDLIDTEVRLVIGYPNLRFSGVASSLLPEMRLDQFRAMLGGREVSSQGILGNPMSQVLSNTASFDGNTFSNARRVSGPTDATAGEASEDLYLYNLGKLTLKKGARAYLPLLDETVSCRHRYDWDVPDQVDSYARFVDRKNEPAEIWHVLRVTNNTTAPWTTAPVLIQSDRRPLAQSMIDYTPQGTENTIKLTKALNLVGQTLEYRTDDAVSKRQEVNLFGSRYELIEVKGRIEVSNVGGKVSPVRINKQLSGDVVTTTGTPTIEGKAKGLGQVNASRTITWEFDLDAGKTWTAEYTYQVLIRR